MSTSVKHGVKRPSDLASIRANMATTCTGNKVTTRAVNDWHGGAEGNRGREGVGGGGGERMESRE